MFSPTPGEVGLVNAIFAQGDPQKLGILTGERATKIFDSSGLPAPTLGDIWSLADPDNNGFLTRKGCAIAVRLIGWVQNGEEPSSALLDAAGPLATLQGIQPAQSSVTSKPASILTGPLPPLTQTDRNKFLQLFNATGPVSGVLSGDKARELFIKSKLPLERLNAIWNLVDKQNRGSLDATEFVLAMYLIQGSMGASPSLPILPPALPPFLVDIAAGRPPSVIAQHTGGSVASPGLPPVSPQFTGASNRPPPPVRPNITGLASNQRIPPAVPARSTPLAQSPFPLARSAPLVQQQSTQQLPVPWDISNEEKVTSDGYFSTLDTSNLGYLEGAAAVPFMLLSNLPEATLASVWDLADLRNDGKLSREAFAVAMRLINDVLAGKPLPASLPVSLVPPSLRVELGLPPAHAPALSASTTQQDLWLLENSPTSSIAALPATTSIFSSPAIPQEPVTAAPFSSPPLNNVQTVQQSQPMKDLLGDDDEVEERNTRQLAQNSAEIANVENQLNSTRAALSTTQTDREKLEAEVANSEATLALLRSQLETAKTGFDTETKLVAALRERYNAQLKDIQTTRDELIRAESDWSALKLEKTEIQGNILRDKDDARELQVKIKETGQQIDLIRKEIEKVRKEAKLQKGHLAIARKQLSTVETERDNADLELGEAELELSRIKSEVSLAEKGTTTHSGEAALFNDAPSSPTQSFATPAADSVKSNNPFDKLIQAQNTGDTQRFGSPFSPIKGDAEPPKAVPAAGDDEDDPFGFNKLSGETDKDNKNEPNQMRPLSPAQTSPPPIEPVSDSIISPVELSTSTIPENLNSIDEVLNLDPDLPPLQEIKEIAEDDSSDEEDFQDARNAVSPSSTTRPTVTTLAANETPGTVSFDDAFGVAAPQSPPTTSSDFSAVSANAPVAQNGLSLDASQKETPQQEAFLQTSPPPTLTTGTDAFDQAFTTNTQSPFVFNSQFDETFDFSSFEKSAEPGKAISTATPMGSNTEVSGGITSSETVFNQRPSFEDAFGVPKANSASAAPQANGDGPLSFEDAFSVLVPTPTPNAAPTINTATQVEPTARVPSPPAPNTPVAPVVPASPAAQEKHNTATSVRSVGASSPPLERSSIRAVSPVNRSPSPKVEAASPPPKGRSSNASASVSSLKGALSVQEPVQTPPTRHSKLGFLLGRSKTKKDKDKSKDKGSSSSAPPVPAVPPTLTGDRYTGPEDDIDAVKQLCSLGFTRDEAVVALEKYGYNFDRALNSLLK